MLSLFKANSQAFLLDRGGLQVPPTSAVALTPFKGVSERLPEGKFASVNLHFSQSGLHLPVPDLLARQPEVTVPQAGTGHSGFAGVGSTQSPG